MNRFSLRRFRLLVLAGAGALAIAVGVASATVPGHDGAVYACFKQGDAAKGGAALFVVDKDSGATCKAGYTEVAFATRERLQALAADTAELDDRVATLSDSQESASWRVRALAWLSSPTDVSTGYANIRERLSALVRQAQELAARVSDAGVAAELVEIGALLSSLPRETTEPPRPGGPIPHPAINAGLADLGERLPALGLRVQELALRASPSDSTALLDLAAQLSSLGGEAEALAVRMDEANIPEALIGLDERLDTLAEQLDSIAAKVAELEAPAPWFTVGAEGASPFSDCAERYGSEYAPVRYRKELGGVVRLSGVVGVAEDCKLLFTLPAGFQPDAREVFGVESQVGSARVDVFPNGDVVLSGGTRFPAGEWLSLSTVTFGVRPPKPA